MNRYLSSFFISFSIYTLGVSSLLYFLSQESVNASEANKTVQTVKFSFISEKPEKKMSEPSTMPEIKPQPQEKPVTKPKPKEKTIPRPKPKVEQKVESKQKPSKDEQKEITPKESSDSANMKSEANKEEKKSSDYEDIKAKQNLFMSKLRELINQNKSYPNSARRRAIEGVVNLRFNILANGAVERITITSGKSIFKKSAMQAVERSFPIKIDKELFMFPKEFKVTLVYTLKS